MEAQTAPVTKDTTFWDFWTGFLVGSITFYLGLANTSSTIAISIFRLQWLTPGKDVTWWNVTAASWSLAELVSGIACSCLPTFKPLLNKVKSWIPPVGKGDSTHSLQDRGTDDSDKTLTMMLEDAPHGSRPQIPNSMYTCRTETSITASKGAHSMARVEKQARKASKSGANKDQEC
jgi:hypothetical protein